MAGRKRPTQRSTPAPEDEEVIVEVLPSGVAAGASDSDADTAEEALAGGEDLDALAADEALEEVEAATDSELEDIERALRGAAAPAAPEGTTALARRDPLSAYMAEARRYPLLSREEEYELAVRWVEEGDMEAAERLVTSNLRLVVKIAHQYRRAYQNLLDLVQEGNVGLVRAVQKFDPYRGVKVSTYAAWWIKAYMLKYILRTWRMVKIGTTQNQRKLFFNLRKQQEALTKAGIEASAENIAEALDVSPREVVEMQRRMGAPDLSLDAPMGGSDGEESSRTHLDLLEDEGEQGAEAVETAEFKDLLHVKLRAFGSGLSGRELEIFEDRLVSDDPRTLQELGDRWGVSRERARQIEKRMVLRLREYLQQELGDAVEIALGR